MFTKMFSLSSMPRDPLETPFDPTKGIYHHCYYQICTNSTYMKVLHYSLYLKEFISAVLMSHKTYIPESPPPLDTAKEIENFHSKVRETLHTWRSYVRFFCKFS